MMKKYSEYKESGVDWIGVIPSGWRTIKVKHLSQVKRGASPRPIDDLKYFDENGEFSWVRISDVTACERYLIETKEKLSVLGASLSVKRYPGDFFLSIAGSVGKPVITKIKCCIHDGFVWFPELKINPEYLFYLFQSGLPFGGLGKLGTQLNLNTESIGNIIIPNIEKQELEQIVLFLDHQTSLIDTIVSKKEKLIELLKEKRQSAINEAVTKGLDPNAKMKDSGIEWLGEIPEEWDVVKLSRFGYFSKGKGITKDKIVQQGYACVRCGELYTTYDRLFEKAKSFINEETTKESVLGKKGDVLMAGDGETNIEIGKAVLYNGNDPIYVGGGINVFTPNKNKVSFIFLSYTLNSSYSIHQKSIDGRGDIIVHIYAKQLKEHLVVLPPISTQIEIGNYLDNLEQKHQQSKSILLEQIEKLKEYRQSLISEAVTGKIDVRDWESGIKN